MARKKDEPARIHPRTVVKTLNAYLDDVNFMQSVMDNAHEFLTNPAIDPAKSAPIVAEQIKEAIDRMQQWRDAE